MFFLLSLSFLYLCASHVLSNPPSWNNQCYGMNVCVLSQPPSTTRNSYGERTLPTKVVVLQWELPWWFSGGEFTCQAGYVDVILELGRSPGEGNGNPLQYSCLGNPMDGGA